MADILQVLTDLEKQSGIPFAYHHFAENESPDPPFIVYLYPDTDNFGADGKVYLPVNEVWVELYTDKKDTDTEALVEKALTDAGIFWEKHEAWIKKEKLYEVSYEFEEVVRNEQEEE